MSRSSGVVFTIQKQGIGRFALRFPSAAAIVNRCNTLINGLGWALLSQVTGIILRLGSSLLLTRLLAPEAFGLMGTAMAFLTTLEWLSDLGIQPAILRHPRGEDLDVLSAGWWLTVMRGVGICFASITIAWPLAQFYAQPELFAILSVLSVRPLLMSFRSPGIPLLKKAMNYRSVFVDETGATLVGTTVSIVTCLFVPNVWAIVAGTLAGAFASVALSYVLVPVVPIKSNPAIRRELWCFGARVLLNTVIMAAWMNLDRLLGLKLVSDADMGIYAVAWNLAAVLDTMLNRACDVHYSMINRIQNRSDREVYHERVVKVISEWAIPCATVAVTSAPFIVGVIYDVRYAAAQPILLILLCRALVRGVGQAQFQLLLSVNLISYGTFAYVVALVVQSLIIWPLCWEYGVNGLALSVLLSTSIVTLVQAALASGQSGFSFTPVLKGVLWSFVPLLSFLL